MAVWVKQASDTNAVPGSRERSHESARVALRLTGLAGAPAGHGGAHNRRPQWAIGEQVRPLFRAYHFECLGAEEWKSESYVREAADL